jgi:fructokinase
MSERLPGPLPAGLPPEVDFDVLAVGELQVEMLANRLGPLSEASSFARAPGGDLARVVAGVARLGRRAAFLGLVGDDPFGRSLIRALQDYDVDTTYVGVHSRGRTPVAFVSRSVADEPDEASGAEEPGPARDKQYLFYREGGADQLLSPAWVLPEAVARARVLVGSGVALASALPRAALHAAIGHAVASGVAVAFDVNWRPTLWHYPERARDLYHAVLPHVDILQLSAADLIMLTGGVATTEGARLAAILHAWVARLVAGRARPLLIALTQGPDGCTYGLWRPGGQGLEVVHLPTFEAPVKDRSGAGDAFLAGLLVALLDRLAPPNGETPAGARLDVGALAVSDLAEIFTWANASGALATTRRGTMAGLPVRNTVLRLVKGRRGAGP